MTEPRIVQTYSNVLEDRRLIDALTALDLPFSLIVHLQEKEWMLKPGRSKNLPERRTGYSYSHPISSILDDIHARRIPVEFVGLLKEQHIPFYEGCLVVEVTDSRPIKNGPNKGSTIDVYVLRPTAESTWQDIRNLVDTQGDWGDREALTLEAKITLVISPPLCLDPSPSIGRTANAITRSGALQSKISLKRKFGDDTDDDVEVTKRAKMMQMMNPRLGQSFTPTYRNLRVSRLVGDAMQPKVQPVQNPATTSNSVQDNPPPMIPTAISQNNQNTDLKRKPQPKIPADAQAAALAAVRGKPTGASVAPMSQSPTKPVPQNLQGVATPKMKPEALMAQITAMQPKQFPLSMPQTKRKPNDGLNAPSPPKTQQPVPATPVSGPSRQPIRLQDSLPLQAGHSVQGTPQMGRQVPMHTQPANPLLSYHQNVANGQQNQMHGGIPSYGAAYPNMGGVMMAQHGMMQRPMGNQMHMMQPMPNQGMMRMMPNMPVQSVPGVMTGYPHPQQTNMQLVQQQVQTLIASLNQQQRSEMLKAASATFKDQALDDNTKLTMYVMAIHQRRRALAQAHRQDAQNADVS